MKILFLFLLIFSLAKADKPVILELNWLHQFEYAGFYIAKEKGYYKKYGLNVQILDGFKKNVFNDVEKGEVDFGLSGSSIVKQFLSGRKFVALGVLYQNSRFVWITDKSIKNIGDFIGKTAMYSKNPNPDIK